MRKTLRLAVILGIDALLVTFGLGLAFCLRLTGEETFFSYFPVLLQLVPVNILGMLGGLYLFRIYRCLWAYASVGELLAIVKAVAFGTAVLIAFIFLTGNALPRSIPLIALALNILLIGGFRFALRLRSEMLYPNGRTKWHEKVLIAGAGDAGALVARELANQELGLRVVGFVDDDPAKQGMSLLGAQVLGTRDAIPELTARLDVDEIIIAMPSAPAKETRAIARISRSTGAAVRMLPAVCRLLKHEVKFTDLQPIHVEDLLHRESVQVNLDEIAGYLHARTVLVTGAGGSIGSELCRQVAAFQPSRLVLLDHCENGVYDLQQELKAKHPDLNLSLAIADVRDRAKLNQAFTTYRPRVVFHAAAHKHVPLMEEHPDEAVKTNVFGTRNVAEAATAVDTEIFIMISTDKAVNPSSVMGATKRLAELIVQGIDRVSPTVFAAVRFGNVLDSAGSVIPLFKEQIARGGPVTVTHPDMRRYFITIPEAVQLVIQAGALAEGGEVFVLDMGQPVKIVDMARDLIHLSGLKPDEDIKIVFIGTRPGEKLFEELLTAEEGTTASKHSRIFVARSQPVNPLQLGEELARLGQLGVKCTRQHVFGTLGTLLPHLGEQHQERTEIERPVRTVNVAAADRC